MRPTRRGYTVVAIVVGAAVAASQHGPRGLDAIIAPGVVALGAGVFQVWRTEKPGIDRHLPTRGTRGDEVTVTVEIDVEGTVGARFYDTVGTGLEATGNDRLVTLSGEPIEYGLALPERGEHAVGPLSIEVTDVLGVVSVTYSYPETDEILVWPRVLPIAVPPSEIYPEYGDFGPERGDFDYLREYQPGDPTHDIHWKSSAKTADEGLLVSEFSASEEGIDAITIAVGSVPGRTDATADSAASLVSFLMEAGLDVGIRTQSVDIAPASGIDHRSNLFDRLARLEPGRLEETLLADPEIHVSGAEDGVLIETGRRTLRFEDVLGEDDARSRGSEDVVPA